MEKISWTKRKTNEEVRVLCTKGRKSSYGYYKRNMEEVDWSHVGEGCSSSWELLWREEWREREGQEDLNGCCWTGWWWMDTANWGRNSSIETIGAIGHLNLSKGRGLEGAFMDFQTIHLKNISRSRVFQTLREKESLLHLQGSWSFK